MRRKPTLRNTGIVLIVIGLVVPIVINAYEEANHLDISRDIGSLPWVIMTIIGAGLLIYSFLRKKP